jgi:hypothetical protein
MVDSAEEAFEILTEDLRKHHLNGTNYHQR